MNESKSDEKRTIILKEVRRLCRVHLTYAKESKMEENDGKDSELVKENIDENSEVKNLEVELKIVNNEKKKKKTRKQSRKL